MPRRPAPGNVRYGTHLTVRLGRRSSSGVWPGGAVDEVGGCVMKVTWTPRRQEMADEVGDVSLKAAVAVERERGAREHGHAEGRRGASHLRSPTRSLYSVSTRWTTAGASKRRRSPSRAALPSRSRSAGSRARRATVVAKLLRVAGEQPGLLVRDDIAGTARIHRRNRHAQDARLDEHAAQRLGPVRREDEERRMPQPREHLPAVEPTREPHVTPGARHRAFRAPRVRAPRVRAPRVRAPRVRAPRVRVPRRR